MPDHTICNLPGRKGTFHNFLKRFCISDEVLPQQLPHFLHFLRFYPEGRGTDLQWIVSVDLNELKESLNIKIPDILLKKYIISSVLVHITEIPIALGVIFSGDGKEIIVPLRIPMLTAE